MKQLLICAAFLAALGGAAPVVAGEPGDSQSLARAKDLIADEQWDRAIEQLKAAAADAKERNKDEALFWLAHSQHQARDLAGAIQTIADLERRHPASRWVKPARSLRVEIAQKLQRTDVLWMTAAPPPPPAPPSPGAPPAVAAPAPPPPNGARRPPVPRPARPAAPPRPADAPARPRPASAPPAFPTVWIPEGWDPDTNLRIQALGSLIQTDARRVIPMLKEIALESKSPREASRAVFVLAQSGNPEAQTTVMEVARQGTEAVQIAAVTQLGRFGGPAISEELVKLYPQASERVKYTVVNALGDREATAALLRIAETESNRRLQERAIVRLARASEHEHLRRFYASGRSELKRPIINGLFNARAEDELIRIAGEEKDPAIRQEVHGLLRLLGTDKARAFLEKQKRK